jgi:hypothetical protein
MFRMSLIQKHSHGGWTGMGLTWMARIYLVLFFTRAVAIRFASMKLDRYGTVTPRGPQRCMTGTIGITGFTGIADTRAITLWYQLRGTTACPGHTNLIFSTQGYGLWVWLDLVRERNNSGHQVTGLQGQVEFGHSTRYGSMPLQYTDTIVWEHTDDANLNGSCYRFRMMYGEGSWAEKCSIIINTLFVLAWHSIDVYGDGYKLEWGR